MGMRWRDFVITELWDVYLSTVICLEWSECVCVHKQTSASAGVCVMERNQRSCRSCQWWAHCHSVHDLLKQCDLCTWNHRLNTKAWKKFVRLVHYILKVMKSFGSFEEHTLNFLFFSSPVGIWIGHVTGCGTGISKGDFNEVQFNETQTCTRTDVTKAFCVSFHLVSSFIWVHFDEFGGKFWHSREMKHIQWWPIKMCHVSI